MATLKLTHSIGPGYSIQRLTQSGLELYDGLFKILIANRSQIASVTLNAMDGTQTVVELEEFSSPITQTGS
jgi:hypothetical protein